MGAVARQLIVFSGNITALNDHAPLSTNPWLPAVTAIPFYTWAALIGVVVLHALTHGRYRWHFPSAAAAAAAAATAASAAAVDSTPHGREQGPCIVSQEAATLSDRGAGERRDGMMRADASAVGACDSPPLLLPLDGASGNAASAEESSAAGRTVQELRFRGMTCLVPRPSASWHAAVVGAFRLHCGRCCGRWAVPDRDLKPVLCGVSGAVRSGELVAVMGASGSGKTMLLNLLAGNTASLGAGVRASGSLLMDGRPVTSDQLRGVTAFVPQEDVLMPTLTVLECLQYSALLRLPGAMTKADITARVQRTLTQVGLDHVASSLVGSSAGGGVQGGPRGISGGERRRVSLGMELVTDPPLMVFDEATTGQDSHTALSVMCVLRSLANTGRAVLCSMHQPSPTLFSLLSRVYLLSNGRCVFSGTPHQADHAISQLGCPLPDPRMPAAEALLWAGSTPSVLQQLLKLSPRGEEEEEDAIGVPNGAQVEQQRQGIDNNNNNNNNSKSRNTRDGKGAGMKAAANGWRQRSEQRGDVEQGNTWAADGGAGVGHHRLQAGWWRGGDRAGLLDQLAVLGWRGLLELWRDPRLLLTHQAVAVMMGIVLGLVFKDVDLSFDGVLNRLGIVFFSLIMLGALALTGAHASAARMPLAAKEVAGGYYSPLSYFLAGVVLDHVLLRALPAVLYCTLVYPIMGLQAVPYKVAQFFLLLAVYSATCSSAVSASIAATTDLGLSFLLFTLGLLLWAVFSNFLARAETMPGWLAWLRYLSAMYYPYNTLAYEQLEGGTYELVLLGFTASDVTDRTAMDSMGIDPDLPEVRNTVISSIVFYFGMTAVALAAFWMRVTWRHRLHSPK